MARLLGVLIISVSVLANAGLFMPGLAGNNIIAPLANDIASLMPAAISYLHQDSVLSLGFVVLDSFLLSPVAIRSYQGYQYLGDLIVTIIPLILILIFLIIISLYKSDQNAPELTIYYNGAIYRNINNNENNAVEPMEAIIDSSQNKIRIWQTEEYVKEMQREEGSSNKTSPSGAAEILYSIDYRNYL